MIERFGSWLVRPVVRRLCVALLFLSPQVLLAQSVELLGDYRALEAAKAAHNSAEVFKAGESAGHRLEINGDKLQLIELWRDLGDYAAQAGLDARAHAYLQRALSLREAVAGADDPDLVPILNALAQIEFNDKAWSAAGATYQRILDIERKAYGERHANVLATLYELRKVYLAAGDTAAQERLDAQIKAQTTAERALPSFPKEVSVGVKTRRYRQNEGFATVRVFYGTNRAPSGDTKPALYYGRARGELQYGYLDVTIPSLHKEAELETQPRWAEYVLNVGESRNRYVLLDKVSPLPRDAFVRALRQEVKNANSRDAFIFVHGFNNSFEDAARRAAQMAYDLDFDGTPLLYSWPSQGSATAYAVDEAAVGISGRKMAEFLETVINESGAERIHVLAHSMGNRALIEAMQTYLAKRAPDDRRHVFGQIVFTAPDVDRDYFVDAIEPLRGAADRVTLYASDNDYALRSSQFLHGAPRAGSAGDVIVRLPGLDTIDMSTVPADVLGHSYFAANAGAIFDVFRLLWRGDAPPRRCGMSDRKSAGALPVWQFDANACKGGDLLEAGVILKRFGDQARSRVIANIALLTDPTQKQEWSLILKRMDALLAAPLPAAPLPAAKGAGR